MIRKTVLAALAMLAMSAAASAQEKVSIAALRFVSSAPIFIAQEKGYFKDAGLEIEFKYFQAAQQIVAQAHARLLFHRGDLHRGHCRERTQLQDGLEKRVIDRGQALPSHASGGHIRRHERRLRHIGSRAANERGNDAFRLLRMQQHEVGA